MRRATDRPGATPTQTAACDTERAEAHRFRGVDDTTTLRFTVDGWSHTQRLRCRESHTEARRAAKTWQLSWVFPPGDGDYAVPARASTWPAKAIKKHNPAPARDAPPLLAVCQADGPARGPVNRGLRSL